VVVATTVKYFLVLWLVATLVNMWIGVNKAGYSVKDEAPIALLVFAAAWCNAVHVPYSILSEFRHEKTNESC
jgi:uncharacterized membrane protein (DUF485 family)